MLSVVGFLQVVHRLHEEQNSLDERNLLIMSFDSAQHPRATDGTFTEKVGASPEVALDADDDMARIGAALAEHLDVAAEDVEVDDEDFYDALTVFAVGNQRYAIGTEEQAQKAARTYVAESLWCMRSSFLSDETGLDARIFDAIAGRSGGGEEFQEDISRIVEGLADNGVEGFTERAIEQDGRGTFISSYDGEEFELRDGESEWYAYRIQ